MQTSAPLFFLPSRGLHLLRVTPWQPLMVTVTPAQVAGVEVREEEEEAIEAEVEAG